MMVFKRSLQKADLRNQRRVVLNLGRFLTYDAVELVISRLLVTLLESVVSLIDAIAEAEFNAKSAKLVFV